MTNTVLQVIGWIALAVGAGVVLVVLLTRDD